MSLSKFVETHLASLALGTVAVAASFYILYGPVKVGNGKNKSTVVGLVNTGNSCFLNSVLQALAACPTLYCWLQRQCEAGRQRANLCNALLKTLAILNNIEVEGNPYSPYLVICALRAHGWVINSEEQDSHEALNAILTTLEEEIKGSKGGNSTSPNSKPTHASLLDISHLGESDDHDESGDSRECSPDLPVNPRLMRGTSLPPGAAAATAATAAKTPPSSRHFRQAVSRDTSPVSLSNHRRRGHHRRSSSGVFSRFGEFSQDTVQVCNTTKEEQSPFTGLLTNKLTPSGKQDKSPVNYSSFNNITLNLPSQVAGYVTLDTLLQMFISQERVEGVKPENSLIKQLTFGKLPDCLCLHIQRTGFSNNQPYKRHEFVEFPSLLSMDKYIYSRQLLKQKSLSGASNMSLKGGNASNMMSGDLGSLSSPSSDFAANNFQTGVLYNLRAVIVHSGGINSGHYITYRRGPFGSKSEKKWFYTSDSVVRQVSFDEVSRSCAYILFYQKE
eukprot:TRINITY_DN28307_c0_g1_i6.p1 TRINITY_DN28307_c0_g1~~TRINITY_DN28307_c0_g1_i6.p1  ORF type:complete len:502 (+),score=76.40 TRINITY_DN28307_c0_g1_i6:76-1581(+)